MKQKLSIFLVILLALLWTTSSFRGVAYGDVGVPMASDISPVELTFIDGANSHFYCDAVNSGAVAPPSAVTFARRIPNNFPLYSFLHLDRDFYVAPDFAHRNHIKIGRVEFAYTPQADYYIYALRRIRI